MKHTQIFSILALGFFLLAPVASAQPDVQEAAPPPSSAPRFSAAELEKLAAPIALHPDPLIAIILPASVYPLEIVQGARFVKDTNNISKVDEQSWDENVRAVAKFPTLIQKMNDDLTWTMDLGQAFLDQQKELMDTIQMLRAKANSAGVLKTTPQQVIVVTNTIIEKIIEQQVVFVTNTVVQIQPANPQVVYVPTYPPSIYYYYPPLVYVGPPPVLTFAVGVTVGLIIANNCDWHHGGIYVGHHGVAVWGGGGHHGDVDIDINRNVNINTGNINIGNRSTPQKWQPDQSRMNASGASGLKSSTQSAKARGWGSGATPAARPSTVAARPTTSSFSRPSPSPSQSLNRASASSAYSRPSPSTSRPSAFGGVSSGSTTRQFSNRGSYSRGGAGTSGRSFRRASAISFNHSLQPRIFMKHITRNPIFTAPRALGFALALLAATSVKADETGKTFATPEAAVAALANAVQNTNHTELRAIFGPAAAKIVNADPVQATAEFATFATALGETNYLVCESDVRRVLEIGYDAWPFPVPIVKQNQSWFFDTAAGVEELLNRRIGGNELETLQVVRTYVQAQREYASRDRDGDDVLEYAQNVLSTPGNHDGLYWSPETDSEISPLGPLVAAAQAEGYRKSTGEKSGPKPFHGYLFKILTRQGKHAPGGKYDYVINGNMIGGFALVAWPWEYGESGIMTFLVNQQGRVYQKNLGPKTGDIAAGLKSYDPDKTWALSPE